MSTFVRLTLAVTIALMAFVVLAFALKLIVLAAVIAAVIFAALIVLNFVRALVRGTRYRLPSGDSSRSR